MYLADIKDALLALGPRFVQIYGQGESPMTITALGRRWHVAAEPKLGTVGRAQSVVEVRIADDNGDPLPAGANGEIEVRGLTVMAGYATPSATAVAGTAGCARATRPAGRRRLPDARRPLQGCDHLRRRTSTPKWKRCCCNIPPSGRHR
jgi:acyl-CoA synthetase (AMP-forming)/AMP-acid ligase II